MEELEEESLPPGTEYVKQCLHPRDQTTQTNILEPYDLDDYDIIIAKDEIQPNKESDNLCEIIVTKDEIQPVTELGNNLYEIMMTNGITKLIKDGIQPVKETESPVLLHNGTCQVTRQAVQVSSDPLKEEEFPLLLDNGAWQVLELNVVQFYNASQEGELPLLLYSGRCKVIGTPTLESFNFLQQKVVESPLQLYNNTYLTTGQNMQESFNSVQEKESPLFAQLLQHDTYQNTQQIMPESSNSIQKKESSMLSHLGTCQVTEQTMQESFNALQEKESPLLLHNDRVIEPPEQKFCVPLIAKRCCKIHGGLDWSDEAAFALLDTYKQYKHVIFQKNTLPIVKKPWSMIAYSLMKKGYNATAFQCERKISHLKYIYRSIKKDEKNCNKQSWKFFNIMDELFNIPSLMTPNITLKDNSNLNVSLAEPNTDSDKPHPTSCVTVYEPPFKRLKEVKNNNNSNNRTLERFEEIVNIMEEKTIERKRIHEEAMARQDKLLGLLDKLVNNFIESNQCSPKTGCTSISKCHITDLEKSEEDNLKSTVKKIISLIKKNVKECMKIYSTTTDYQDKLLHVVEKNDFNDL